MRAAIAKKMMDIMTLADMAYLDAYTSGDYRLLWRRAILLNTLEMNMPPFAKSEKLFEKTPPADTVTFEIVAKLLTEGKIGEVIRLLRCLDAETDLERYIENYRERVLAAYNSSRNQENSPNPNNRRFKALLQESVLIQRQMVSMLQSAHLYLPTQRRISAEDRIDMASKTGFSEGVGDITTGET